jgi:hypothetical protein
MKILKILLNVYFLGTLVIGAFLAINLTFFNLQLPSEYYPYTSLFFIIIPLNTFILVSLSLLYHSKYVLKRFKKLEQGLTVMYKTIRPSVVVYGLLIIPMVINLVLGNVIRLDIPASWESFKIIALYIIFIAVYFGGKHHKHLEYMYAVGKYAVMVVTCIALGYFLLVVYMELKPQYYFTFNLEDPKGIYVVNYDGDYWLTYYVQEEQCLTTSGTPVCTTDVVKKGNAAISEIPIRLESLLDKPVRVTGEFVPKNGSISGTNKKMCIAGTCSIGTGPGVWHSSPIKIKSIEQVEYLKN